MRIQIEKQALFILKILPKKIVETILRTKFYKLMSGTQYHQICLLFMRTIALFIKLFTVLTNR